MAEHGALVARLAAHEAVFSSAFAKHRAAILSLIAERDALASAIDLHNSAAKKFPALHIGGAEELHRAALDTRLYKNPEERAAETAAMEAEQRRAYWERADAAQKRLDAAKAFAASRPAPEPFFGATVNQPSNGATTITRA